MNGVFRGILAMRCGIYLSALKMLAPLGILTLAFSSCALSFSHSLTLAISSRSRSRALSLILAWDLILILHLNPFPHFFFGLNIRKTLLL